ncbi:hypothetical protein FJZ19_05835, partial [Candidatus Pacearchaeota archaeon]|nr:hypothetical protein [Candidatus Pacearchaeota archaeon]
MKRVLYPNNELDVLAYYSKIARVLEKFLAGRELAAKIFLRNFAFLKRGSNSPALFISDLKQVNEK